MYEIKELSSKIGGCSKAVFLGERYMYPVYDGREADAQRTVDAANRHIVKSILPRKATSHA